MIDVFGLLNFFPVKSKFVCYIIIKSVNQISSEKKFVLKKIYICSSFGGDISFKVSHKYHA